ncbi:hypothetical protein GOP47_0002230 [Adiantum capillus-veneris]|uniref:Uncharacterized protein n=1 Tax=Adiantum capillus-veneris TaxID=13818 RepID=A0A9D4VAC0_ADICA|nr:hypothetical protein GOP47_0002230 [Adiantum capillus-veneris]
MVALDISLYGLPLCALKATHSSLLLHSLAHDQFSLVSAMALLPATVLTSVHAALYLAQPRALPDCTCQWSVPLLDVPFNTSPITFEPAPLFRGSLSQLSLSRHLSTCKHPS